MKLEDIRKEIDSIDSELKELLLKRFNCSYNVAMSKIESGNTVIYRADREQAVLDRLKESVPEEVLTEYLAIVKRYMESSRMYQYGLIFDRVPDLFNSIFPDTDTGRESEAITVSFRIPSRPNALSSRLCMIGDHGCVIKNITMNGSGNSTQDPDLSESGFDPGLSESGIDPGSMTDIEITIGGNIRDANVQKLLYQLSMETEDFEIKEIS